MGSTGLVGIYLLAIVAANLSSTLFGASASIINAALLIGLDLSARDRLHEAWRGHLARNMALLIATGSALSWLVNRDAGPIAVASLAAFACAAVADTLVYQAMHRWQRLLRMNGSNMLSALADSIVFPWLAWGSFAPAITIAQWTAKVGGGFLWSLALGRHWHWWREYTNHCARYRLCRCGQWQIHLLTHFDSYWGDCPAPRGKVEPVAGWWEAR